MTEERLKNIIKKILFYNFEELEAYGTKKERATICKAWACQMFDILPKEYDDIMKARTGKC